MTKANRRISERERYTAQMTEPEHTCHTCPACLAIPEPPEIHQTDRLRDLVREGFVVYDHTGNLHPRDYARVSAEILKRSGVTRIHKGTPVDRAKAKKELFAELATYTETPPFFLPLSLFEKIIFVNGGAAVTDLRRATCGGEKGYFVQYGAARRVFLDRWALCRRKVKSRGRPPGMPLLTEGEWPWTLPATTPDPADVMPPTWNPYSAGVPMSIHMLPRYEGGLLRSHVKAIRDALTDPASYASLARLTSTGKRGSSGWGADRWAAAVITERCLKVPYKPYPPSLPPGELTSTEEW